MPLSACEKIQRSPTYECFKEMIPKDPYRLAANILGVEREDVGQLSMKKVENHDLIEDLVFSKDDEVIFNALIKLQEQLASQSETK